MSLLTHWLLIDVLAAPLTWLLIDVLAAPLTWLLIDVLADPLTWLSIDVLPAPLNWLSIDVLDNDDDGDHVMFPLFPTPSVCMHGVYLPSVCSGFLTMFRLLLVTCTTSLLKQHIRLLINPSSI